MSKKATFEVWAYLSAQYPEHAKQYESPDQYKAAYRIFHELLDDIDDAMLKAAAKHHAASCKWFPKVSELREAAFSLMETGQLTAGEAWEKVCNEIRRVGIYDAPKLEPQVKRAVDAMGGWRSLCESENNVADRAHFLKIFEAISNRDREDRRMLPEVREVAKRLAAGIGEQRQLRAVK